MNSATDTPTQDYCISKAAFEGSNLYYATLFEPKLEKQKIITFHAFYVELCEVIAECSDPGIARIKFKWWQEEITRLYDKQARHPVTKEFIKHINIETITKTKLLHIIQCFENLLFLEQTDNLDQTLDYFRDSIGEVWLQNSLQLNITNEITLGLLREAGAIYHYLSCIQQPHLYINASRCIIPSCFIEQSTLLDSNLKKAHAQTEIFLPLMQDIKQRLDETRQRLSRQNHIELRHAIILCKIALALCKEIEADGNHILTKKVRLTPIRKLWIAWLTNLQLRYF